MAGVALVASLPGAIGLTSIDPANQRYAACLADQTGGKAELGRVTDAFGGTAFIDPVLRPHGTDMLGRRPGAIIAARGAPDTLSLVLKIDGNGYKADLDYVRVAGQVVPGLSGTWGKGDIAPNAEQVQLANFAQFCANRPWVQGPRGVG